MMPKPYKVIEEAQNHTVYEYKTIYLWLLYAILGILGAGVLFGVEHLSAVGGGLMVLYFLCVSVPYRQLGKRQREAMTTGSVEITGSKWSFKNPLRVKIPKTNNI